MNKTSVKFKISVSVLAISVVSSLIIGVFCLITYKKNLENYLGKEAMNIALTVSANIDGDKVKAYDETEEKDDYYDSMQKYLSDVKKNTGLTYLYIMTDAGNDYKYISEGYLEGEDPDELGDTDSKDEYGAEPSQVYQTKQGIYSEIYDSGEWGELISGFAPVFDSNNNVTAVIGLDISADTVSQNLMSFIPILIIVMVFSCFFAYVFINTVVTRIIVKPIIKLRDVAEQIASGNFSVDIPQQYCVKCDEIGCLSKAFQKMSNDIKAVTQDISNVLHTMSELNLRVKTSSQYFGDYLLIHQSIENISSALNQTLSSIKISADEVKNSSIQVSSAAQSLSQGASEQAAAIEELQSLTVKISKSVENNAENVSSAVEYAEKAVNDATEGNDEMRQMLESINNISEVSNEIGKIIKVIDDIAFQTNILALNAAVEAARAGASGKGFAVVADEVRNLASKSAQAAKQTADLISNSINVIDDGSRKANNTARTLNQFAENTKKIKELMMTIDKSSVHQAAAIKQINSSIEQISIVIQTNSATAEESAAASEVLSSQAVALHGEIDKFTLQN